MLSGGAEPHCKLARRFLADREHDTAHGAIVGILECVLPNKSKQEIQPRFVEVIKLDRPSPTLQAQRILPCRPYTFLEETHITISQCGRAAEVVVQAPEISPCSSIANMPMVS